MRGRLRLPASTTPIREGARRRLGSSPYGALFCLALCLAVRIDAGAEPAFAMLDATSKRGGEARADSTRPGAVRIGFGGYVQLWWTIHAEAENGLYQPLTHDRATQETSGFSLHRARIAADFDRGPLCGRISMRLEGSPPALLDAYAHVPLLGPRMHLWVGQMKIPSTYEVATGSEDLDFLERTRFSRIIADFSLSRSPAISSPRFYGVKTYLRDLGLALKGEAHGADYSFMVGNGIGANRFVGGMDHPEEVESNRFGAYLYGIRVSAGGDFDRPSGAPRARPVAGRIGAHILWNRHPNMVIEGGRAILDLDRRSWSADAHVRILDRISLTSMYGCGTVMDDFDADGKTDYEIRGLELKAQAEVLPRRMLVGFRYDLLTEEWYENGVLDESRAYEIGATILPLEGARIKVSRSWNTLDSIGEPDPDDDALVMEIQIGF